MDIEIDIRGIVLHQGQVQVISAEIDLAMFVTKEITFPQ